MQVSTAVDSNIQDTDSSTSSSGSGAEWFAADYSSKSKQKELQQDALPSSSNATTNSTQTASDTATVDSTESELTNNCARDSDSNEATANPANLYCITSTAELARRQRTWLRLYFRFRLKWVDSKKILQPLRRSDAYLPVNLNRWTRYVMLELHRKRPFIFAIKAFTNRVLSPDAKVQFTLGRFWRRSDAKVREEDKDKEVDEDEEEKKMKPVPNDVPLEKLPILRCPDDIEKFRNIGIEGLNIFVTNTSSHFEELWDGLRKQTKK